MSADGLPVFSPVSAFLFPAHTHTRSDDTTQSHRVYQLSHSLILPQRRGSCRHFCNAARSCTAQSHLCVHRHAEGPHPEVEE